MCHRYVIAISLRLLLINTSAGFPCLLYRRVTSNVRYNFMLPLFRCTVIIGAQCIMFLSLYTYESIFNKVATRDMALER